MKIFRKICRDAVNRVSTVAIICIFIGCKGFSGVFDDKKPEAFVSGSTISLPTVGGGTLPATVVDVNGDGVADGLDINGDGIPDILYISIGGDRVMGLDVDGDGRIDYYLIANFDSTTTIKTTRTDNSDVKVTTDASGAATGFDTPSPSGSSQTIFDDVKADTTPPTANATPVGGSYAGAQTITLACTDNVACNAIAYTTDGSLPAFGPPAHGTVVTGYAVSFTVAATSTVRYVVRDAKGNESAVTDAAYTITPPPPGDTTPPGNVTSFTATPGDGTASLSWINPGDGDFAGVKILRKTGSYPANKDDGTEVYTGTGTAKTDTGLTNGTQYFYKAFAYDTAGNYASGAQATATPVLDSTAPTLLSSTPSDGATGVAPCSGTPCTAKIVLVFSESMQTTTPTLTTEVESATGTWVVTPNTGTTFTWGTTTYANDTLTINISWYWFPEQSQIQYTLAVSGLQDVAGNPIATNIQQSFTTTAPEPTFAVPDTGQTACYDDMGNAAVCSDSGNWPRQDGYFADTPNPRSYTGPTQHAAYTSDYTTKDNTTGLVWKTCSEGLSGATCTTGSNSTMPWNNAVNQCAALNSANSGAGYAGIKTWRLPTKAELETIVDYGKYNPAINATYFPVAYNCWSSSTYVATTTGAWFVNFYNGNSSYTNKTVSYYVRCVSSGP